MLGSRTTHLPRARTLLLAVVIAALLGLMVVAVQHEMGPGVAATPPASNEVQLSALSPDEEAYAAALWPIHSEVVEASAVEVSFAGISYVTEDHDAHKLAAKALTLQDTLRAAGDHARALQVPGGMEEVAFALS